MFDHNPELSAPNASHAHESAASRKAVTTYGSPSHPLAFTISIADNGLVGYTGILKPLCMKFIWTYGCDFRIGWYSENAGMNVDAQVDVGVRLASGDECEWWRGEEGCRVVGGGPVFWDRVVVVGPVDDSVGLGTEEGVLGVGEAVERVLRCVGEGKDVKFLFSGEGSATFGMEQEILRAIDLGRELGVLRKSTASSPLTFLTDVSASGAYALTTRSLFLTAHRDGLVPNLKAYVEGGHDSLRPWYVLVRAEDGAESVERRLALRFAEWLGEETAQGTLRGYGRVWEEGVPLFTGRGEGREDVACEEGLVGRKF